MTDPRSKNQAMRRRFHNGRRLQARLPHMTDDALRAYREERELDQSIGRGLAYLSTFGAGAAAFSKPEQERVARTGGGAR